MSYIDDNSDSSSDDVPVCYWKMKMDHSIARNLWPQIDDKFQWLLTNANSAALVEFLQSLLTFIRRSKENKDSRKFSQRFCKYLFATKFMAKTVDQSFYKHLRPLLVLYSALQIRLISAFDDDSMVASKILSTIVLLMQGSTSISVLDVLVDIDEDIQGYRAMSIKRIIYRKFLNKNPLLFEGPRLLDDISFVKHLILFRSWYTEETVAEKLKVFKCFVSTIKPSQQLRRNPSFLLLRHDDSNEMDNYKKLLQQPLHRNALVRAVRDAESEIDYQDGQENIFAFDLPIHHGSDVMKVEIGLSLHLPDEVICVDDDIDILEIGYLPDLFERFDNIERIELRQQYNVPTESIVVYSDSDGENCETIRTTDYFRISQCDSPDQIAGDVQWEPYRRRSLPIENKSSAESIRPILRTSSTSHLSKKVTFNPRVTKRVCETFDYECESTDYSMTPTIPSIQTDQSNQNASGVVKKRNKRRRTRFYTAHPKRSQTSMDQWYKRKKLTATHTECSSPTAKERNFQINVKRLVIDTVDASNGSQSDGEDISNETAGTTSQQEEAIPHLLLTNHSTPPSWTVKEKTVKTSKQSSPRMKGTSKLVKRFVGQRRSSKKKSPSPSNVAGNSSILTSCVVVLGQLSDTPLKPTTINPMENEQRVCETIAQFELSVDSTPTLNSSVDFHSDKVQIMPPSENSEGRHEAGYNECQTSCNPDTLSSSMVQRSPLSDISSNINLEEQPLRCMFDDCETPSPVYSPLQRKRSHENDERLVHCFDHFMNASQNDDVDLIANLPIEMEVTITTHDDNEMDNDTNVLISQSTDYNSSESTLLSIADELDTSCSPQLDDKLLNF